MEPQPSIANHFGPENGETRLRIAELEMIADGISDEQDPGLIQRLSTFLQQGIMGLREAREILERVLPPRIINFPGATQEELQELTDAVNRTASRPYIVGPANKIELVPMELPAKDLNEPDMREWIQRLYAQGLPIREMVDRMAMEGYNADTLLLGYDPGAEVAEPMHTFRAEATGELESGDLVVMDGEGNARRAREGEQVIGVALNNNGLIRFNGGRMDMSWANRGSIAYHGSMMFHASIAYGPRVFARNRTEPPGQRVDAPAFKYTERFPKEVEAKAMELLRKFMSPEQYEAFVDRADIELENKAGDTRLIINQNGGFTMMRGGRGAGIVLTSGNVRSYRFPLGDEIAAFLDWFRYKTPELIQNWNCGNFGIIRDGIE